MTYLDSLVPGGGDDLPVVGGECHGENVLGVVLEAAGGLAGGQVPQTEGLVPRAGQGEVTVRGQDHVRDEVTVAVQPLLGDPVVTHVIPGEEKYRRFTFGRKGRFTSDQSTTFKSISQIRKEIRFTW